MPTSTANQGKGARPAAVAGRSRGRLSGAARREQLLDSALRVVTRQGFHTVSVEAVAQRARVTRAVIYQHFRDLNDLLEAVIKRESDRALAQLSETTLTDLSQGRPDQLMLESLRAYLLAVQAHPDTWRLMLMPPEGAPRALRKQMARGRSKVLAQMAAAVKPLFDGRPSDDPEITARILAASSDEYARLVLTDPVRYSPDRLVDHARRWLRRPLLASAPAYPPVTQVSLAGDTGALRE